MALENLKRHLELKGSGKQSAPDKVLDVLLAAATNNTSIEHECSSLEGAPSPNTVRGVLRESLELLSPGKTSESGTVDSLESPLLERTAKSRSRFSRSALPRTGCPTLGMKFAEVRLNKERLTSMFSLQPMLSVTHNKQEYSRSARSRGACPSVLHKRPFCQNTTLFMGYWDRGG